MENADVTQKNFLNGLNDAQRQAVENTEGPALVIAGAGSGKTRVLTYRIANLLTKGVPAYHILALTFTNKAAREMKERISTVVGEQNARDLWMGTFHSIFSKILRQEAEAIGFKSSYTIYDTTDSKSLIRAIIKDKKLNDKTYRPNDILNRISTAKNNLITPEAYQKSPQIYKTDQQNQRSATGDIYTEYARRCRIAQAMDFDDLLLFTNILFRDHPKILEKYQRKFRYILVDEYQDTNFSQYLIIKKLSAMYNNICVVGDDAQSIYSFRGAKIENILNFRNDYKEYKLFKLEQNYRSTQTIVDAANSIIAKNREQIPKQIYSQNNVGEKIKLFIAQSDNEEGFLIANDIADTRMSKHLSYDDFAILYRTNAQSRIFEEALRRKNIPYKVFGSISFYQRKEIKDVLSYYRLMINADDNEAFKRIINYPARGIGATTLGKLENAANNANSSLWDILTRIEKITLPFNKGTLKKLTLFREMMKEFIVLHPQTDAFELAEMVVKRTGILQSLQTSQSLEERSKIENIEELLNAIKEYSDAYSTPENPATLDGFMENVALLTDADTEEGPKESVSIMTIHAAKGLEFEYTYIAGVEDELFPSQRSMANPKDMEEERRLFYVAVTRAKSRAVISMAKQRHKWGNLIVCQPSRFIKDIDPQYLDMPGNITQNGPVDSYDQRPPEENNAFSKYKNFTARRKAASGKPSGLTRNKQGKLISLNKAGKMSSSNKNFKADDPSKITEGSIVEHQRFGKGKVIRLDDEPGNKKATVFFEEINEHKHLLLKFAKLRIIQ